jgi:hypothetical protein
MSHFIGGDSIPVKSKIRGIATEIIPPNFRTMLQKKGSAEAIVPNPREAMMETRRLAQKFIDQEEHIISYENVKQKEKEFEKLKERLYRYGQSKPDNSNLLRDDSGGQPQDVHLNLTDNNRKIYI